MNGKYRDRSFVVVVWSSGRSGHWLGREDSNLRMAESKSAALPLGYAPTALTLTAKHLPGNKTTSGAPPHGFGGCEY
jgi:hypothetical protein